MGAVIGIAVILLSIVVVIEIVIYREAISIIIDILRRLF